MDTRKFCLSVLVLTALGASAFARTEIRLDLSRQRAYLLDNGDIVATAPIASGRRAHPTPSGSFRVVEKDIDHRSTMYGKMVNSSGRVVKSDADSDDPVPRGGRFVEAPMRYFLRFTGPIGMHAGRLPGYPASHGCVRLPSGKAAQFYNAAQIGTPVRVTGRAPYR
jgi:lipoprotein-anchoring transpeptidase ErfK/SrfK